MNINELVKEGTFDRSYRKKTFEASLNPAIAFALNKLAGLDDEDRILDPCCGTATILIERQLLKPAICIGVDINPKYLEMAKENIEAAHLPVTAGTERTPESKDPGQARMTILKHGDITGKKFPDNYFTKIISNLPFGIHSGSREKNKQLYKFLADKAVRWLKPGGTAVFITNAKSLLRDIFAHNPTWELLEEIPLEVSNLKLSIFIFRKL
jgi:tRNA (guanine6-N2)-methyltransferase